MTVRLQRKRAGIAHALLFALCALFVAACSRVDPVEELAAATASFERRDFKTAAIRLSNLIQADPDNADARLLRGNVALATRDFHLARVELDRARALGSTEAGTTLGLAEAVLMTGDPDGAMAILEGAEASFAQRPEYWALRAESLLRRGDPIGADAALSRAEEIGDLTTRGLLTRARLELIRGAPLEAERVLSEAARRTPTDADVYVARAEFYARAGKTAEAASDLLFAIERYKADGLQVLEQQALLALVQVYLAANDLDAAGRAADELNQLAPHAPAVTAYVAALIDYRKGRFEDATAHAEEAVSAQPDNVAFLTLLGAAHLALANLGQAEEHFLSVLRSAPQHAAAIKLLAETRLRQERPEAALDVLRPLISDSVDDVQVAALSGAANMLAGNVVEGLYYLEQASALDPANERLKMELARGYFAAGRGDKAASVVQELVRAASVAPRSPELSYLIGIVALKLESTEEALSVAKDLQASFPRSSSGFLLETEVRLAERRYDTASESLRLAFEREPTWVIMNRRVMATLLAGRTDDAVRLLETWLESNDTDAVARLMLAELLQSAGDGAVALSRYLEVVDREPRNAVALNNAAWLAHEQGRADALALAERAYQVAPENPAVQDTLGWILVQRKREQDGVLLLERAAELTPDALAIRYHLAYAYSAVGRRQEALEILEAVARDGRFFDERRQAEELIAALRTEFQ